MPKEDKKEIHKSYEFKDFAESMRFVRQVADLAEIANHHPKIQIDYNKVKVLWRWGLKGQSRASRSWVCPARYE